MDELVGNNDRLLYELEQFLLKNNANDYLHYFLMSMYSKITSGEIILILAPVDSALARLVERSEKSLEEIINLPEGRDILTNFLSSAPVQQTTPVYTSINRAYLSTINHFNRLNSTASIQLGNLFVATVDGIIKMPGQLERLQQSNLTSVVTLPRTDVIGGDLSTQFDSLPRPIIRKIALDLSLSDIVNNCRTSILFNTAICDNENFWQEKIRKDFPQQKSTINNSWKNTYHALSQRLYTFGSGMNYQLGYGNRMNTSKPLLVEGLYVPTMVTCGQTHTAVIANNQLYTFGEGGRGQLGHGDLLVLTVPTLVEGLNHVSFVACGQTHTAVIANNQLYTFGNGGRGRLGHGDDQNQDKPKLVEGLDNVTYVACGHEHTAAISNGQLYTFGHGGNNRLGHNDWEDHSRPTLIERLNNVTVVSCGALHTAVISNNRLYTCGLGLNGELGHGDNQSWGRPKLVEALNNVTFVACGNSYTAVISNKRLYTFGVNSDGQLGRRYRINRYTKESESEVKELYDVNFVACGEHHTAAISNGQLYTFGRGNVGQLGHEDNQSQYKPKLVEGLNDVSFVACGPNHTAAIANHQ